MEGKAALLGFTVFLLFSLIVVGAYVAAGGFGEACGSAVPADWPLCNGSLVPPPNFSAIVEYTHRILAAFSTLFLLITTVAYWRGESASSPATRALAIATLLVLLQVVLGGLVVAQELEAPLVALHQAVAILVFGFSVAALAFGAG
ncbi:MAG: COX15/CtaA family protein [Nitrososphaerota archaeon]|nr:COX15/CtaA family protein [Nitrososphaerota archaeon]